jgi:hypothetical protein
MYGFAMLMAREIFADLSGLLELRRHLSIVHHLPGRIRLRLGPALWGHAARFDRDLFQDMLEGLEGIRDLRVNKAVASVVIEYDPAHVPPEDWETLVLGEAEAAGNILKNWLVRHDRLIQNTLMEKE